MKLLNKTNQKQQIHLVNGSSIMVLPKQEVEVDPSMVFEEERKRLLYFCDVIEEDNKPKRNEYVKSKSYYSKKDDEIDSEKEGGN